MPGIVVEVRDSVTQAPLHNATLHILSEGSVVDSAGGLGGARAGTPLVGVYERPGVYHVTVERRGYAPWRRNGIQVVRGECHVEPMRLVANMTALR
jgi:hypothetical protein